MQSECARWLLTWQREFSAGQSLRDIIMDVAFNDLQGRKKKKNDSPWRRRFEKAAHCGYCQFEILGL
ncbi:rCG44051, isoform CRA_c [Rattus norvegicus]|uniref:RCG44051, isoform CRA_c n=1 Tax=Rattus norvegicus TaxID=10116 RepID=A6J7P0_RAT|nr:rCG44051, isoform CRA_c [Rattus norvegicus]